MKSHNFKKPARSDSLNWRNPIGRTNTQSTDQATIASAITLQDRKASASDSKNDHKQDDVFNHPLLPDIEAFFKNDDQSKLPAIKKGLLGLPLTPKLKSYFLLNPFNHNSPNVEKNCLAILNFIFYKLPIEQTAMLFSGFQINIIIKKTQSEKILDKTLKIILKGGNFKNGFINSIFSNRIYLITLSNWKKKASPNEIVKINEMVKILFKHMYVSVRKNRITISNFLANIQLAFQHKLITEEQARLFLNRGFSTKIKDSADFKKIIEARIKKREHQKIKAGTKNIKGLINDEDENCNEKVTDLIKQLYTTTISEPLQIARGVPDKKEETSPTFFIEDSQSETFEHDDELSSNTGSDSEEADKYEDERSSPVEDEIPPLSQEWQGEEFFKRMQSELASSDSDSNRRSDDETPPLSQEWQGEEFIKRMQSELARSDSDSNRTSDSSPAEQKLSDSEVVDAAPAISSSDNTPTSNSSPTEQRLPDSVVDAAPANSRFFNRHAPLTEQRNDSTNQEEPGKDPKKFNNNPNPYFTLFPTSVSTSVQPKVTLLVADGSGALRKLISSP